MLWYVLSSCRSSNIEDGRSLWSLVQPNILERLGRIYPFRSTGVPTFTSISNLAEKTSKLLEPC